MDEFQKSCLFFICLLTIHAISAANDTIHSFHSISEGETLVSSGGMFELGFFSPGNSVNRYVGIWYKNVTVQTVVWVANRQVPLTTKSGVFSVTEPGILTLLTSTNGIIIWSSNATRSVRNPAAQLLDSGNLVVKDANDDRVEDFVWQSFDHPTDTYLPGMSFGWNLVTGKEIYFLSWRSNDDPGEGEYSSHLDPTGYPQAVIRRGKTSVKYRIGPWNGLRFCGAPDSTNDPIARLAFRMNKNEVTYKEITVDRSVLSKSTVSWNGDLQRRTWNYRTQAWTVYINIMPTDNCDSYGLCGAHGICNIGNSPYCVKVLRGL